MANRSISLRINIQGMAVFYRQGIASYKREKGELVDMRKISQFLIPRSTSFYFAFFGNKIDFLRVCFGENYKTIQFNYSYNMST